MTFDPSALRINPADEAGGPPDRDKLIDIMRRHRLTPAP